MKFRLGTTLLLSLAISSSVLAIPARSGFAKVKQPDGTEISVKICGDERLNWFETEDGYKLLRDQNNYLVYAVNNEKGDLVPSTLVYGRPDKNLNMQRAAMKIAPNATFSQAQIEEAVSRMPQSTQSSAIFPSEGKCNLLMILVNFADTEITIPKEDIEKMMNEENYKNIGSFRDFMLEASNNKLDITTTVTDWIQIRGDHDDYYYNQNGSTNVSDLIMDALLDADESVDFSQFDNNKDGYVDGIMILHQGYGQESSGSKNDIWSHSFTLQNWGIPVANRTFDGVRVNAYTIEPELITDQYGKQYETTIGVFCHEFTHNLGAPDYYDADGNSNGYYDGTGKWDLMAEGSWNGVYGDHPAMINAFERIRLGWLPKPIVLEEDQEIEAMPCITNSQLTYRINTEDDYDYFLLENRQQSISKFDSGLLSSGLVIYHINENFFNKLDPGNRVNSTSEQSVYVVAGNASCDPDGTPKSFGYISRNDAIYGGSSSNGLNKYTYPSNISWAKTKAKGELYNIKNNTDGTVSFSFYKDRKIELTDVYPIGNRGKYTITFNTPDVDGGTVMGYNVYTKKNDEWSKYTTLKTNRLELNINSLTGKSFEYAFDITFENGTSSNMIEHYFFVPEECLQTVEVIENGRSNTINWTADEEKKNGQQAFFMEYKIYRNDEVIGHTTENTFTDESPLEKAVYTVVSVWENEVELKGLTTSEATGICDKVLSNENNFKAYYNTLSGSVTCDLTIENANTEADIEVYNTVGQRVASDYTTMNEGQNTIEINLGSSAKGVYIVTATLKNNGKVEKISKKIVVM